MQTKETNDNSIVGRGHLPGHRGYALPLSQSVTMRRDIHQRESINEEVKLGQTIILMYDGVAWLSKITYENPNRKGDMDITNRPKRIAELVISSHLQTALALRKH